MLNKEQSRFLTKHVVTLVYEEKTIEFVNILVRTKNGGHSWAEVEDGELSEEVAVG